MLSFQQYLYAKEAAFIMKIFSQRASHVLIKVSWKHILLWTTNEWLTELIHIFTVKTIPFLGTHNISGKKKKQFKELKKCICLIKYFLYYVWLYSLLRQMYSMLSQIISAKPSMENLQTINSESTVRKTDLTSLEIIKCNNNLLQ